jgi:UPF0716 protein FxsA
MLLVRIAHFVGPLLLFGWLGLAAGLGIMQLLRAARGTTGPQPPPPEQLADRAVRAAAAVLLIIPGFISDIAAAALLVPGNRRALARALAQRFVPLRAGAFDEGAAPGAARERHGQVIEGEFTRRDEHP